MTTPSLVSATSSEAKSVLEPSSEELVYSPSEVSTEGSSVEGVAYASWSSSADESGGGTYPEAILSMSTEKSSGLILVVAIKNISSWISLTSGYG